MTNEYRVHCLYRFTEGALIHVLVGGNNDLEESSSHLEGTVTEHMPYNINVYTCPLCNIHYMINFCMPFKFTEKLALGLPIPLHSDPNTFVSKCSQYSQSGGL